MNSAAQVLLFPEPEESSPGQKFALVWQAYIEAMVQHHKALNGLSAMERSLFPGMEDYRYAVTGMSESEMEKTLGKTAKDIRSRLSWLASRQFAPPGGRLDIDDDGLTEAFPFDQYTDLEKLRAYDPIAIWAWLEERYGGDVGEKLAYQQLAERINSALGLRHKEEVVMKGGYVVLSRSAWTDTYSSGIQYSYSTYQDIQRTLISLGEVAEWMERHQLARDLYSHAQNSTHCDKVISREKFGFGENGAEALMVTFKTSVEFRLRADFAEQLQIFLGTYGSQGD